MTRHQHETLVEQADALISAMTEHESELYVSIEQAHQMRDELVLAEPGDFDAD